MTNPALTIDNFKKAMVDSIDLGIVMPLLTTIVLLTEFS